MDLDYYGIEINIMVEAYTMVHTSNLTQKVNRRIILIQAYITYKDLNTIQYWFK